MIAGAILESYQGKFAKVVRVQEEGGLYTLSAWVPNKEAAAVETVGVTTLNKFGLSQVLKDTSVLEEKKEKKEKKAE